MGQALQNNNTLKRLELRQMLLSSSSTLSQLLLTAKSPKELVLQQIGFQGRTEKLPSPPESCHGGIENLDIIDCPMMPEAMENIVYNTAWMPALKTLELKFNPSAPGTTYLSRLNLTNALKNILRQNKLQILEVDSVLHYDFDPICEALRTNSSLCTIDSDTFSHSRANNNLNLLVDVLQKDNTTLQQCGLASTGRHDKLREKAIELIRLNRFGRGRARAGDTTVHQFLKDLDKVQNSASLKLPIDKLNTQYGLLRETPSLWCNLVLADNERGAFLTG